MTDRVPACQHDGVDEVKLTIRLSAEDRQALRLHAVLQGRSVQDLVTALIRAELGRGMPAAGTSAASRQEFVASLYARYEIDPDDPSHRAIEERARASVRQPKATPATGTAAGGERGAA